MNIKRSFEFKKDLTPEEVYNYSHYFGEEAMSENGETTVNQLTDFSFRLLLSDSYDSTGIATYPTVGVMVIDRDEKDLGGVVVLEFAPDDAEIANKTFDLLKDHFENGGGFSDMPVPEIYHDPDDIEGYNKDIELIKNVLSA